MKTLLLLVACLGWSLAAEQPTSALGRANAWLLGRPAERSLAEARQLLEACIVEQAMHEHVCCDEDPYDHAINNLLSPLSRAEPPDDDYIVNRCEHLILRYGDDFKRSVFVLEVLLAAKRNPDLGDQANRAYLQKRERIVLGMWKRLNGFLTDRPTANERPLNNLRVPDYTGMNEAQRVAAQEQHRRAVAHNEELGRRAARYEAFGIMKDYLDQATIDWARNWYLPQDAERLRNLMQGAGFIERDIARYLKK